MKFPIEEMLAKLPLPANEKWKEGVWDVEPLKLFSNGLRDCQRDYRD